MKIFEVMQEVQSDPKIPFNKYVHVQQKENVDLQVPIDLIGRPSVYLNWFNLK